MKIDLNDPRITAFALGELSGDDAIELARAVRTDARISKAVDEVRETAILLGETLSSSGAEMLTRDQRDAVRSAGVGPVITDIASARVPFWKKPAVAAVGVAAAVAVSLYLVGEKQSQGDDMVAQHGPEWNWSQVDTGDLTAPILIDSGNSSTVIPPSEAAHAVSAAMSDDTQGFRATVKQRVESSEMKAVRELPDLQAKDWQNVSLGEKISVPMSSGAASWPWIKRHIMDAGQLPPRRAVRIEEMINHFSYSKPTTLVHGGLAADVEICRTPWNPQTRLLAVHLRAQPGAETDHLKASVVIGSKSVQKLRLLGYAEADAKSGSEKSVVSGTPGIASRTHGNYVLFELVLDKNVAGRENEPLVSLNLGGDEMLAIKEPKSWEGATHDLRFASMIAATGMVISDYPASGELDAKHLGSLLDDIDKNDGASLTPERKEAMKLIRKALGIIENSVKR